MLNKKKKMFTNPQIGLRNLGNTCYANVCIQVFAACHTTRFQIQHSHVSMPELAKLFERISSAEYAVSPHDFLFSLCDAFRPSAIQHDAHEFLLHMFNTVLDVPVCRLFCHRLTVVTTCNECHAETQITSSEYVFSVPTDSPDIEQAIANAQRALDFERKCPCSSMESTQEMSIHPSNAFLVHIKRFDYDVYKDKVVKLFGVIRISRRLVFYGVPYELRLVVLHVGDHAEGGHYIVDVLDSNGDRFSINDSVVGPIPLARPRDATPYLLLYVRL